MKLQTSRVCGAFSDLMTNRSMIVNVLNVDYIESRRHMGDG